MELFICKSISHSVLNGFYIIVLEIIETFYFFVFPLAVIKLYS